MYLIAHEAIVTIGQESRRTRTLNVFAERYCFYHNSHPCPYQFPITFQQYSCMLHFQFHHDGAFDAYTFHVLNPVQQKRKEFESILR